jgi:hypothetical protein
LPQDRGYGTLTSPLPSASSRRARRESKPIEAHNEAFVKIIQATCIAAVTSLCCAPSLAASYPFILHNFTGADVTRVTVKDGKVIGFKRVFSKSSRTFTVEFPDGKCVSRAVRISFENGAVSIEPNYNVCTGGGVTVVGR